MMLTSYVWPMACGCGGSCLADDRGHAEETASCVVTVPDSEIREVTEEARGGGIVSSWWLLTDDVLLLVIPLLPFLDRMALRVNRRLTLLEMEAPVLVPTHFDSLCARKRGDAFELILKAVGALHRLVLPLNEYIDCLKLIVDRCSFDKIIVVLPLTSSRVPEVLQVIRRARVDDARKITVFVSAAGAEDWQRWKSIVMDAVRQTDYKWELRRPEEWMDGAEMLQLMKALWEMKRPGVSMYHTSIEATQSIATTLLGLRSDLLSNPPDDVNDTTPTPIPSSTGLLAAMGLLSAGIGGVQDMVVSATDGTVRMTIVVVSVEERRCDPLYPCIISFFKRE